jgi:hypothetical protein
MDRKGQKIGKVIQKEKENEVKQSRKRKADDKKTEKEGAKPSAEKPVKRRRRRKGEELLVEEANELVLKGKELDRFDWDREAMAQAKQARRQGVRLAS